MRADVTEKHMRLPGCAAGADPVPEAPSMLLTAHGSWASRSPAQQIAMASSKMRSSPYRYHAAQLAVDRHGVQIHSNNMYFQEFVACHWLALKDSAAE